MTGFMDNDRGMPLWLHIAAGTTVGVIAGGFVLWAGIRYIEVKGLEIAAREFRVPTTSGVPVTPRVERPATQVTKVPVAPCKPSDTLGDVNGRMVCVGPTGELSEPR